MSQAQNLSVLVGWRVDPRALRQGCGQGRPGVLVVGIRGGSGRGLMLLSRGRQEWGGIRLGRVSRAIWVRMRGLWVFAVGRQGRVGVEVGGGSEFGVMG